VGILSLKDGQAEAVVMENPCEAAGAAELAGVLRFAQNDNRRVF
jgi:hypothetical protein